MSRALTEALAAAAAPPCTGYSCPRRRDCASKLLACDSFVYYVNTGRAAHPLMMFQINKNGWKPMHMLKQEHAPTRALYDRVFKEEV
jgi:hypothetical protein